MNKILIIAFSLISLNICAQDEVTADWNVSVNGDEVTISIEIGRAHV